MSTANSVTLAEYRRMIKLSSRAERVSTIEQHGWTQDNTDGTLWRHADHTGVHSLDGAFRKCFNVTD